MVEGLMNRENPVSHSLDYTPDVSDVLSDEIAFAIANWSPIPGSSPAPATQRSLLRSSKDISTPTVFFPPPVLESGTWSGVPVEEECVIDTEAELADVWVPGGDLAPPMGKCTPDMMLQQSIASLDFFFPEPDSDTSVRGC
jgi:hypothetical protein